MNFLVFNFSDCCCVEGNLPLLSDLSWPIQAHVATRALIPHYNVPDPLTDEGDATNNKHMGKQLHEHEQEYNAEMKSLNIIHTNMHNPSYT